MWILCYPDNTIHFLLLFSYKLLNVSFVIQLLLIAPSKYYSFQTLILEVFVHVLPSNHIPSVQFFAYRSCLLLCNLVTQQGSLWPEFYNWWCWVNSNLSVTIDSHLPASAFCCFSIFSRRPSKESILVLIWVNSFLIVCNSSDFTGKGKVERKKTSNGRLRTQFVT